ncbi:cyanophycinase [Palleronia marisminoris]|uniref:Cyanophycinase n=1 Tax=Palleronia marisminoris TaxID=315423 RepID=A0A1Y5RRA1_9RHOB|nr:cyanophycinase [Palleronia marisminoris]SFG27309.1 cyanophycinase [Palleronia marisminoris]SLN20657.1 Cyanophycinase [Palleronia marisminoris]
MNMPAKVSARGPLVAIGGAEDKSEEADILSRVLRWSGLNAPVVGVITTASAIPDEVFASYRETFAALGASEVLDIRVRDRADAANATFVDMIGRADVIFISGGDQMRLTNVFGGSAALNKIRTRHAQGAVVAGTSAGAACQSQTMVYGGSPDDSLRKGAVKMTAGFGFVNGVIIDTHFLQRGRFSRLMEVGATNPEYLGVGLGEDAAVLFEGDVLRAIGPGHVILVDSSTITGSNVFDLEDGEAVAVHNVTMHALISGYGYNLRERRVLGPGELGKMSLEHSDAHT